MTLIPESAMHISCDSEAVNARHYKCILNDADDVIMGSDEDDKSAFYCTHNFVTTAKRHVMPPRNSQNITTQRSNSII